MEERREHDRTNRLLQLRRRKRLTDDEQAELNQERTVTLNVAVLDTAKGSKKR